MTVTLAEEIMLLSPDDESGAVRERQACQWAVAGGIVLELVMSGRLSADDGRITVGDTTPTGIRLLDDRLQTIAAWAAGKSRPPKVTEPWPSSSTGRRCTRTRPPPLRRHRHSKPSGAVPPAAARISARSSASTSRGPVPESGRGVHPGCRDVIRKRPSRFPERDLARIHS
ncbi:GPP34 family phosphoprotein [Streptomyces sp. NPDC058766]